MLGEVKCHHCAQTLQFDDDQAGSLLECPLCHYKTRAESVARERAAFKNEHLTQCPVCDAGISKKAFMCPRCGHAAGVRFRFVWDVMCHIALATLIFAFIGAVLGFLFEAVRAANG